MKMNKWKSDSDYRSFNYFCLFYGPPLQTADTVKV